MASRILNTFVITPTGTSLTLAMIHLIIRVRDSLAAWEISALNCGLDERHFPYDLSILTRPWAGDFAP